MSVNRAGGAAPGRMVTSTRSVLSVGLNTVMEVAPPTMSVESGNDQVGKSVGTPRRTESPRTPPLDSVSSSAATTAPVRA